ncbi:1,4-alpha-glucan-branching enzyme [Yasminevirus sp. GU-2018]|uniref:1,4-alpha-glucan-branching enzyme n=1 Tax=Yasminevirus sp. GU-2018 TaxID=2420051 RepID=A0A5K0U7F3_9VIRU|nr:1,4-alpha-glucan-branching enzyme [Yasminevirus sp. GU-2018]
MQNEDQNLQITEDASEFALNYCNLTDPHLSKNNQLRSKLKILHWEYLRKKKDIKNLEAFSRRRFGFFDQDDGTVVFKEWAPNAKQMYIMGTFNNWSETSKPLKKVSINGVFSCVFEKGELVNGDKIKLIIITQNNKKLYRVPSHALNANEQ